MPHYLTTTGLAALALTACTTATTKNAEKQEVLPPYQAPATLAAATEGVSEVALFEVGDDDTTVYLLGTVHILQPDTAWKTDAYEAAFAEADAIYVEADTSSPEVLAELQPLVMQYGLNPEGVTLSSYFTPEEQTELSAALSELGLPMANLDPMRPWLASITAGVVGIQSLGGDPEAGVEKMIEADAAAAGKPLRYLETARSQIEALASVPDDAMADAMVADGDAYADFESYFAKLIGAWYDGRVDVVGDVMNEGMQAAPALGQALLYNRNADWAEKLQTLIETEDGVYLVAVGAGHLAGEKSVQEYLSERGYETKRR